MFSLFVNFLHSAFLEWNVNIKIGEILSYEVQGLNIQKIY